MFVRVVVVFVVVLIGLAYEATKPPPPKICGSPNGPPVTSPRIKLSDGRFLAYKESGVSKEKSKYKIVVVHGFDNSKHFSLRASQELIDELGIYFVSFDRAGYGESDPNPKRSVKSEAFDIQELADQLELGSKFYIIGASMGGYPVWSCLKYIPHRIAGASLIVPLINYWWPSFPKNLSTMAFKSRLLQDQWVFRVAHYVPGLVYWWNTQKWFPGLGALEGHPDSFCSQDKEILKRLGHILNADEGTRTQQGVFESLHRDMIVGLGNWEFDPLEMNNPFSEDESNTAGSSSVQIWQGHEDKMIPVMLQRYVSEKLPWIRYYEVRDAGHFMVFETSYTYLHKAVLSGNPDDYTVLAIYVPDSMLAFYKPGDKVWSHILHCKPDNVKGWLSFRHPRGFHDTMCYKGRLHKDEYGRRYTCSTSGFKVFKLGNVNKWEQSKV